MESIFACFLLNLLPSFTFTFLLLSSVFLLSKHNHSTFSTAISEKEKFTTDGLYAASFATLCALKWSVLLLHYTTEYAAQDKSLEDEEARSLISRQDSTGSKRAVSVYAVA